MTTPDTRPSKSTALRIRDWAHVVAPVLAGLFVLAAVLTDPAAGLDGDKLARLYADNPDGLAVHALTLHFGYALLIATALFAARLVRGKGAWIANVAAVLGFLGITTLPGLMFADFLTAAITQEFGVDGTSAVDQRMSAMWGVGAFVMQGLPAALLAPTIAAAALWRAGVVKWWGFAAAVVGEIALLGLGVEFWWGAVLATVLFVGYSFTLHRAYAVRG